MEAALVDTQILVWALSEPGKLPAECRAALSGGDFEFFIRPCAFWECQIKFDLGKLHLPGTPEGNLLPLALRAGFKLAAFEVNAVFILGKLPAIHRDPFDRLMIAHCILRGWPFLTADENIVRYPIRCVS